MIDSIVKELEIRKNYLPSPVSTIYFGGGTPSLLEPGEIHQLLSCVFKNFRMEAHPEITLEANPDDITAAYLKELKNAGINRLSIGVQSFFDRHLSFLGRRHTAEQAQKAVGFAQESGFQNISMDLIYGIPGMTLPEWEENLRKAIKTGIPHISAYHLTFEKGTPLYQQVEAKRVLPVDEEESLRQMKILKKITQENGFIHYEISNFGKKTRFSRHNCLYWKQEAYLGAGPSAHSYNKTSRQWNIADADDYIQALFNNTIACSSEIPDITDRYNELIMTGLRTIWGVNLHEVQKTFGDEIFKHFCRISQKYLKTGRMKKINHNFVLTDRGQMIADRIMADIFYDKKG